MQELLTLSTLSLLISIQSHQVDPKEVAKLRALEAREEKKMQQVKRETTGMKKMSSFFAPKALKKV